MPNFDPAKVEYKNPRSQISEEKRDAIRSMLKAGKRINEIAGLLGSCHKTVSRIAKQMGVREKPEVKPEPLPKVTGELVAKMPEHIDWVDACKAALGDRFTDKTIRNETVYFLDGFITSSCKVIDTYNRIAPMLGKPHIGKKPNEIYKPRLVEVRV